ncbi:Der GTPase-activating protein YihI [Thalassotalea marina]|uniref:Der GTPase-activating protein YihI n=1 Tax=Thalassotalea marina TaxID=1673741 RepID=A0A919BGY0_9GAMM|nr:Der GTPase-activating protein YihI [Thalassotalea marina]GHF88489.1 Der GTPase-activating protein YihI [Thalassotalea marina]
MTRHKKTRKPPQEAAKTRLSKKEKQQIAELRDKKPKKQTGNKPGNRQQEAVANKRNQHGAKDNKDPRLGSKKPIDLGVPAVMSQLKPNKKSTKSAATAGIAAIRVLDETKSISAQIAEIEQDEALLAIIAKQEDDIELTEQEVDYYNELMERHETLSAQLPVEEDTESSEEELDEDSLWDKLDKTDFSEYQ